MDSVITPLLPIGVGLFYAVGGVLLLRRLPGEMVMDEMLGALGDPTAPAERSRTRFWMLGGAAVFASGLSLILLSRWAPTFFILGSVLQASYLAWVARALPAEDAQARAGRRAVVQAFVLYLAATGFVLWLDGKGAWRSWLEPAMLELAALLGVTAAVSALLLRGAFWRAPAMPFAPAARPGPTALRLTPEYRMSPLRDRAENVPVEASALGLDAALVARIAAWDGRFQAIFDDENPFDFAFPDLLSEQRWFEEGLEIAADIQMQWEGLVANDLSGLSTMLRYARRSLEPAEPTPIEEAAAMAPRCGVAEIREAIDRLDRLAWEAAEAGDPAAITREQDFFTHLLAHVRDRYLPELRRGLDSTEAATRQRVAQALRARGA